ncbi:MAG: hypothetical protein MJ130_08860 [Lachnospiraceae bacterium]|nr:hypothetical protein [Lachnospiraceae bacterium]
MKGYNSDFGGGGGNAAGNAPVNGEDYNGAGSSSVKNVDSVNIMADSHSVPTQCTPNSVTQNFKDGKLDSERYYDDNGNAYLDIDYTNHGNPKTHHNVPHEHDIWFDDDGGFHRGKDNGIR